jgi:hypothetical protein
MTMPAKPEQLSTSHDGTNSPNAGLPGKKVFLAVPIYGQVAAQFMASLVALNNHPPRGSTLQVAYNFGDSLVTRARNRLTADFLAGDFTHLLFLDSDLEFNPACVNRIFSHSEDVVAGIYPIKKQGILKCCLQTLDQPAREDGLMEVKRIGTGFMCIARDVFSRILLAHGPEIQYKDLDSGRTEYDFWRVGVRHGEYLSEDWWFCDVCRELGIKIWADTQVLLNHVGQVTFPLQSQLEAIETAQKKVTP